MTVSIKLKSPIEVGGESIAELKLEEPTVRDIRETGLPFSLSADGKARIDINADATVRLVAKLAKLPPSALNKMSLADFMQCQAVVMSFFGD